MVEVTANEVEPLIISDRIIPGGPAAGKDIHYDVAKGKPIGVTSDNPIVTIPLVLNMESVKKAALKAGVIEKGTDINQINSPKDIIATPTSNTAQASGNAAQSNARYGSAMKYGFRPNYRPSLSQASAPVLSRVKRVYSKDERRLIRLRESLKQLMENATKPAHVRVENLPATSQERLIEEAVKNGRDYTPVGDIALAKSKVGKGALNEIRAKEDAKKRRKNMPKPSTNNQTKHEPWGGKWAKYIETDGPIIRF